MEQIKASLVGCGRMGQVHAQVLKELGINVTSLADKSKVCTDLFIDKLYKQSPPASYRNLTELLANEQPDLLVIATTSDGHADHAIEGIKAGVPLVFLEKPVTNSLKQCLNLKDICQNKCVRLAVNHQMRYLSQYQIPKELMSSEAYGGLKSMHVSAGNFGLAMNGTHYLEAFRYLSGENIVEVSAWFDAQSLPNPRGAQFNDVSGCLRATTSSGRRLYIDSSINQGHGVQVTYMGRNGRITIDELTGTMTTVVRQPEHREAPTSRYGMPVDIKEQKIKPVELVDSTKAVLKALVEGEDYPTLHDGTLAVKSLIAAYHSHRKGGNPVKIADIPDNDPEVFPWA